MSSNSNPNPDMQAENSNTETASKSEDRSFIGELEEPSFGWTPYAERMNGRFAMIGFSAVIIIEIVTGKGFLAWAGLL